MSKEPLLQVMDLTKKFDGATVLEDVDLTIAEGEKIAVIGPNGAGKTTLANLIIGRLRPTRGRIIYMGREITGLPPHMRARLGISYTLQSIGVFRTLTIRENVELAEKTALGRNHRREYVSSAIIQVLEMAGITSQMDRPPSVLSPGHQRIVEVAMAAMTMPSLLILDEPTQGLGEQDIGLINRMIEALGDKTSLMIIEHNVEFVLKIAERIVVLDRGRILTEGTPEEVVTNESVQRVYLGR